MVQLLYGFYNEFLSELMVISVFKFHFITTFLSNLYAFGQEITEKNLLEN